MIRKNLGLYFIAGIAALISIFLVVTMTLQVVGIIDVLKHTYSITFKNYDETVLSVEKVERGNDAEYSGEMPERPATNDFYYVFIGWDHSLLNVQASFETYAQYSTITNNGVGDGTAAGEGEDGGSQGETQDDGGTSHTGPGTDTVGGGGEGTGTGGASGGSGGGGGGGGGGGTDGEGESTNDKFQIKTFYTNNVYLRSYSYGTQYHPEENVWDAPEDMFVMSEDLTNPLFYTSFRAANADGISTKIISLHYTLYDTPVPIPLYPFKFVSNAGMDYQNDRYIYETAELDQEYAFASFEYNTIIESNLRAAPISPNMSAEEARYRDYVASNYLSFDVSYYPQIVDLYFNHSFQFKSYSEIIEGTQNVVRYLGKVNNSFVHEDEETDLGDPISNLFVDGIARAETYANVATFLLRYSNIPARTVKGYRKNTNGVNEFVDVTGTDTYYWTEFYINGVGWMFIDPIPTIYTNEGTPEYQDGHGSGGGGGGGAGVSGSVSDTSVVEDEETMDPNNELLKVTVNRNDIYHIRERSFVTYSDGKWGYDNDDSFLDASLNPIYYTSDKMNSALLSSDKVDIEYLSEFDYYPTPQYDAIYNTKYVDDNASYIKPINSTYSTTAYSEISYSDAITSLTSVSRKNVGEAEVDAYRDYVYNNYLAVPSYLTTGLDSFLTDYDLHSTDSDIVNKLTTILRDSSDYIYGEPEISVEDGVLHFLNSSKVGKCGLFAASSVLLYRRLGIPSRYVVGFLVDARDEKEVTVLAKSAHAWCEVYDDNVGWIMVDNTTSLKEHKEVPITPSKLYFSVSNIVTEYTGSPVDSSLLNVSVVSMENLDPNHVISGFSLKKDYIDVGYYNIELSVQVTDNVTGEDVSKYYAASVTGALTITHKLITVTTGSATRAYNGLPLTDSSYSTDGLVSGHTLSLITTGSITEKGACINRVDEESIHISDANGKDVSANYMINFSYGVLRVI